MIRVLAAVLFVWAAAALTYPALSGAHRERAAVRQEQEARHG